MTRNKKLSLIILILIVIALPLFLIIIKQNLDNRSSAAAPDKLEAEGGVLGGNAQVQSETNASGGQYVAFANPTPTPTPTTTQTQPGTIYNVPASIDGTGNTNVTLALQAFINSVPDGTAANPSIIVFPAGKTYAVSPGINFTGRSYLIFDGSGIPTQYGNTNGAVIKGTANGISPNSSMFISNSGSHHITFRNINLVGSNPESATNKCWNGTITQNEGTIRGEYQMGIAMYGANNIEISHVVVDKAQGDDFYLGSNGTWNDTIWIHNSTGKNNGRMALGIIGVNNLIVEDSSWQETCMYVFDEEPNVSTEGTTNAIYRRNTIGNYGWSTAYGNNAILDTSSPATTAIFGSITFDDNIVTGKNVGNQPANTTPFLIFLFKPNQTGTVNIRNNKCTQAGPAAYGLYAVGITNSSANYTITNNTGCLTSGSFVHTSNFTGTLIQSGNN